MKLKIYITLLLVCAFSITNAQLTINPGGFITIGQTGSMYVGTSLHINSDASGSGYWVDLTSGSEVTISGSVDIERYLSQGGWHNTSAPVSNTSGNVYTGTDLVFYYDESIILNDWNFGWVWYSGTLDVMKGYDVYISSPLLVDYTSSWGSDLNTGNYTISVTRTDVSNGDTESHKGWNLIGNPYPSPVDWLEEPGWDKSDINDAKYIWNPSNNNYTIFLGGSNPTGLNGGTQYIPSNQGFWVQAIRTGTVEINNACRTGTMTSTPDYYKTTNNSLNELRIIAKGNGYYDETMVRFLPAATADFDINIDASKLFSPFDSIPQICTLAPKQQLSINSLPGVTDNLKVNMDFYCNVEGIYTLFIADTSEFLFSNQVYLMDIRKQKMINLNKKRRYTFYHNPEFSPHRFTLCFNPSNDFIDSLNPDSRFTVSTNGNTITIERNTQKFYHAGITIYNMMGQLTGTYTMSNDTKTTFSIQVPRGYYIVSIKTLGHLSNIKVFLSG